MSVLKKAVLLASRNHLIQNLLEKNVKISQDLMGIGSGGGVLSSGEQGIFTFMKQKLKPPYCVFDVGSNQGQFLHLALDYIDADMASIHCFEPGQETFKMLAKSSRDDKRIKLNNMGLGREKGEAVLYFDCAGSGLASLTKRKLDHFDIDFSKSEKVIISCVDDYCLENAINRIHLLKIDVEGHELGVLAGARKMFDAGSIDMVTFEFGGCNIDTRTFFQDFWYFFQGINMQILRITPSGYFCPMTSYQEIYEQFRTTNFIAISKRQ